MQGRFRRTVPGPFQAEGHRTFRGKAERQMPGALGRRWWSHDFGKHHPAATSPADPGSSTWLILRDAPSVTPLTSKSASWTSSSFRRLHLLEICASLSVPEPARSPRLTGCAQRLRSPYGHAREPFPVSASEPPGSPGGLRISASTTTRGFLTSLHLRTWASPLRETHHDHYQDHPPACRQ